MGVYTYWGGDICVLLLAKFIKLFEPAEILLLYWRNNKRAPQERGYLVAQTRASGGGLKCQGLRAETLHTP